MNKITTSNTSTKKSLLAGFLDETRAASRRSDATSAVQAKAGGKAGSVMGSTATDPKPVQTFLSDALEKALAATNAAKSDVSTARAKASGFTGATAGQTTTAYASQQTQNRLKDAVDAAIAQVNAMKATNDSYVDEQTVRPTAEQKRQATLVARLPEDFPIDEWESLPTKAQLKKMQNTRLSKTEQWDLLNTKTSMSTLRGIGEQTASQTAMLQAVVDRIINGEVTNSSKLTPLQQRVLDRQLEKEEEAMRSVAGRNATPLPGPSPLAVTPNPYADGTSNSAAGELQDELEAIDSDLLSSGGKHLLDLALKKLSDDDLSANELSIIEDSLLRLQKEEQKNLILTTAVKSSRLSATWNTNMINNQDDYSHTPGTFGDKGNIADNGCGFIAINNANQLLGDGTNFIDTYDELNSRSKWTTVRNGELGMNPLVVGNYYRTKGYDVDLYTNSDEVPNNYDAYIMFYGYTKETGDGKYGAHYIAIDYDKETGKLIGYNNNRRDAVDSKDQFLEFMPDDIGFDLFIWGINKPDAYQPQELLKGSFAR